MLFVQPSQFSQKWLIYTLTWLDAELHPQILILY